MPISIPQGYVENVRINDIIYPPSTEEGEGMPPRESSGLEELFGGVLVLLIIVAVMVLTGTLPEYHDGPTLSPVVPVDTRN